MKARTNTIRRKPRELTIRHKSKARDSGDIILTHLSDSGRCYIGTTNYGKVTSASLSKSEVKRTIKWLQNWVEFKENEHRGNDE